MRIVRTMALAAIAGIQLHHMPTRSDPVLVTAVFDGDTIQVQAFGRVRLLGIDAPEVAHGLESAAPFGKEAKDRLTGLLLRRWIRLEQEGARADVYGRGLAYVLTEDGVFVNALLVREGLARVSSRLPLLRLSELQRAEAEAQTYRRGMWGATPQIPAHADGNPTKLKAQTRKRRTGSRRPKRQKATVSG